MRYLADAVPGLSVHGNDPSEPLLEVAQRRFGIAPSQLDCADSTALPYEDGAFDVVIETAVLHHVPEPDRVIQEMLRVSSKAIFISDSNAYALGGFGPRLVKVALAKTRTLRFVNRLRRHGHDWYYTEGDGIGWSYSVYDSLALIRSNCHEVLVIPTQIDRPLAGSVPFLFSPHILVAGFKEPLSAAHGNASPADR
jgi:SAM-dependent methyltransferase